MSKNTFFNFCTLLFLGLKLTGNLAWPWFFILMPIWFPLVDTFVNVFIEKLFSEET